MVIALLPTPPSPTTTSLYVGNGWLGAWVMARRWRVNSCCVVYANLDDSLSAARTKRTEKNRRINVDNESGPTTFRRVTNQVFGEFDCLRDRTFERHRYGSASFVRLSRAVVVVVSGWRYGLDRDTRNRVKYAACPSGGNTELEKSDAGVVRYIIKTYCTNVLRYATPTTAADTVARQTKIENGKNCFYFFFLFFFPDVPYHTADVAATAAAAEDVVAPLVAGG